MAAGPGRGKKRSSRADYLTGVVAEEFLQSLLHAQRAHRRDGSARLPHPGQLRQNSGSGRVQLSYNAAPRWSRPAGRSPQPAQQTQLLTKRDTAARPWSGRSSIRCVSTRWCR
ncbi:hypothetical protein HBB16_02620 [Pseudonocardia sp. MCCB 268]|nr:hypothetical protein [Pseudonocardia cytotoxica]